MMRTTQNVIVLITLVVSSEIYINNNHICIAEGFNRREKENSLFFILIQIKNYYDDDICASSIPFSESFPVLHFWHLIFV